MTKNKVQFQKWFSLLQFNRKHGQEKQFWQALFKHQYSQGFVCSRCQHPHYYQIKRGQNLQCQQCNRQHSKLPFRLWFLAIYLITQSKKSISSFALMRDLNVHYNTAWLLQQKSMHAPKQQVKTLITRSIIYVADNYWGGRRRGSRGRGAKAKQAFITALSLKDGKPDQLKFALLKSFSYQEIRRWRANNIAAESSVFSDALPAFPAIKTSNRKHIALNISNNPQGKRQSFSCN